MAVLEHEILAKGNRLYEVTIDDDLSHSSSKTFRVISYSGTEGGLLTPKVETYNKFLASARTVYNYLIADKMRGGYNRAEVNAKPEPAKPVEKKASKPKSDRNITLDL